MACNCAQLGLTSYNNNYYGFASDSSGSNFSLNTPLATSRYIAFLSQLSTLTPPTTAAFAGKWVSLYGSTLISSKTTQTDTVSGVLTEQVLETITIPKKLWQIGNSLKFSGRFVTNNDNANTRYISLYLNGIAFTNFFVPLLFTTISGTVLIGVEVEFIKKTAYTADAIMSVVYQGGSPSSVGISIPQTITWLIDMDSVNGSFTCTGTTGVSGDTVGLAFDTLVLTR